MKNRFFVLMLLVGALSMTLTSCNEDILPDNGEENGGKGVRTVKLGVQIESGTKVTLSNDATPAFAWEVGDKIGVWVGTDASTGGFQDCEVDPDKKISVDLTGGDRYNYAVYPNDVDLFSYSGGNLTVKLPATYALSEVSGENGTKTPLPMVAVNDKDVNSLTFYNVGGALRLTVKSIPADATGLVIQFPGNKVNGTFAVTNPGSTTPTIATGTPAVGEDRITVNFAAGTATEMTLNIPLPTGAYEDVYITPVGSETKVAAVRHINAASYTATRANGKKLTTTMVAFSVSSTKKVLFSPGNLVKTDGTYEVGSGNETYAFEATPFNTNGGSLGYGQGSPTSTSARGYFRWPEIISDGTTSESPRLFTVSGIAGWRVLTRDEWYYLLVTRSMNSGVSPYYRVRTGGSDSKTFGLLLPPDNATSSDKEGVTLYVGSVSNNVNVDALVEKGWIFLPGAGGVLSSGNWDYSGQTCYYWSSTSFFNSSNSPTNYARTLVSNKSSAYNCDGSQGKGYYLSVRLVYEL